MSMRHQGRHAIKHALFKPQLVKKTEPQFKPTAHKEA